jgi:hypothetical protein
MVETPLASSSASGLPPSVTIRSRKSSRPREQPETPDSEVSMLRQMVLTMETTRCTAETTRSMAEATRNYAEAARNYAVATRLAYSNDKQHRVKSSATTSD